MFSLYRKSFVSLVRKHNGKIPTIAKYPIVTTASNPTTTLTEIKKPFVKAAFIKPTHKCPLKFWQMSNYQTRKFNSSVVNFNSVVKFNNATKTTDDIKQVIKDVDQLMADTKPVDETQQTADNKPTDETRQTIKEINEIILEINKAISNNNTIVTKLNYTATDIQQVIRIDERIITLRDIITCCILYRMLMNMPSVHIDFTAETAPIEKVLQLQDIIFNVANSGSYIAYNLFALMPAIRYITYYYIGKKYDNKYISNRLTNLNVTVAAVMFVAYTVYIYYNFYPIKAIKPTETQ